MTRNREARNKIEQHLVELMKICEEYGIQSVDIRATNHGYGNAFAIDKTFIDITFLPEQREVEE